MGITDLSEFKPHVFLMKQGILTIGNSYVAESDGHPYFTVYQVCKILQFKQAYIVIKPVPKKSIRLSLLLPLLTLGLWCS